MTDSISISPIDALERLREGNRRFASNVRSVEALVSQMTRKELVAGQNPFAIVLACSDSRARPPPKARRPTSLGAQVRPAVAAPLLALLAHPEDEWTP